MNPMLHTYFKRLNEELDLVQEMIQGGTEELKKQKAVREDLLNKFWARGKEITVLNERARTHADLQEENARLQAVQQELQSSLNAVLEKTKVLSEALRQ